MDFQNLRVLSQKRGAQKLCIFGWLYEDVTTLAWISSVVIADIVCYVLWLCPVDSERPAENWIFHYKARQGWWRNHLQLPVWDIRVSFVAVFCLEYTETSTLSNCRRSRHILYRWMYLVDADRSCGHVRVFSLRWFFFAYILQYNTIQYYFIKKAVRSQLEHSEVIVTGNQCIVLYCWASPAYWMLGHNQFFIDRELVIFDLHLISSSSCVSQQKIDHPGECSRMVYFLLAYSMSTWSCKNSVDRTTKST